MRISAGLTHAQLAARARVGERTVRDLERGARPRAVTLHRLAAALGVDAVQLDALVHAAEREDPPGGGRNGGRKTGTGAADDNAGAELRVDVLGPLQARRGRDSVVIPSGLQRTLLGLLASQPDRVVGVEEIIDVLWDSEPPRTCRELVRSHVSGLGRRLVMPGVPAPAAPLRRERHGYRLRLGLDGSDAARFEDLAARARRAAAARDAQSAWQLYGSALDCWRGPLLVGEGPWRLHHPAAVALTALRTAVAVEWAEIGLGLGSYAPMAQMLQVLCAEEPLHEGLAALLMLAWAGEGRQAAALTLYSDMLRRLDAGLGVEPGPVLREAHLRVLHGRLPPVTRSVGDGRTSAPTAEDAAVAKALSSVAEPEKPALPVGPAGPTVSVVPPAEVVGLTGPRSREGTVLLDRTEQLAVVEHAAAEARAGQGAVVLVRAGAGMGKTSLLNVWACAEQVRGMRVLRADGGELEQDFAFSVLRQLVEPLLARADPAGRERLLSGPAELASYALRVDAAAGGEGLSPEASLGVLHSLYWLMVHVADDGPIALVVDDAHWADVPSVRWLEYLARRVRGLPLLVVLAARADSGTRAEPLLERIGAQAHCRPVELPSLAADSVAALVRTRLGDDTDPQFAAACAEATRGNPLLLRELLRTLADNGVRPAGDQASVVEEFRGRILAGTVVRRLAGEPEPVRLLVRALVVLGDGVGWQVAAELAGLGEARARELGHRLQRIGVLAPGGTARFAHPLVRAAITEAVVGPVELADGHAQAAGLLRREGASEAEVAAHLLLAEPNGEAWRVEVLREAARATRGRGAPEVTVTYLRRALREPMSVKERGPLLLELGADELQVDAGTARHRLAQAADALTDPYARAQAAHLLAHALFLEQQHEDAVEVLARAVEDLREAEDGSGLAREVSWYLHAQMLLIGYDQLPTLSAVRLRARRLRDHVLAGDTPGECAVLAALSVAALSGDGSAAVVGDLVDRALRGGLAGADQSQMLLSLAGLAFVATDRLDDAAARFDQIADVAGRWGSFLMVSAALTWQVSISRHRGRQLALTPGFGHPAMTDEGMELRVRTAMMTQVGESLIERGDLAGAARVLAPDADSDRVGWAWQGPLLVVRSRLHAERGRPAAALAVLLEYGAQERWARVTNLALAPWRSQAALAHHALGQRRTHCGSPSRSWSWRTAGAPSGRSGWRRGAWAS
ncbi:AAA family ATPase [Streptacidiphilus sp. 4-A2]|nr:AAA family ATPase [Streptacidiphilus sp. 4-A2]